MHLRPVFQEITLARADPSHQGQRQTEGQMILRCDMFHQHEMLQEMTPIKGKMVEPKYPGAKGDQCLITCIILRSVSRRKYVKKQPQIRFTRFIISLQLEHLHEFPHFGMKLRGGNLQMTQDDHLKIRKGKTYPQPDELTFIQRNRTTLKRSASPLFLLGQWTNPRGCQL